MELLRRAYAKVNLVLSVGPPVPTDGGPMHPIASWMHSIDLCDTITLTWLGESHSPRFEVRWATDAPRPSPIDWPQEKDLALRALRLIEQTIGRTLPVSIRIEKRVPVGGGLGGGSSDAAAVLTGLRDLASLPLTDDQLARLSTRLGSDVAFFIDSQPIPRPALVTGMGDHIARLDRSWAGRPIVLAIPPFGCATGPVYKAYDQLGPRPLRDITPPDCPLFNDLLPAAERIQPALAPLRHALESAANLPAHMSGSGSTLFVLPEAGRETDTAAKIRQQLSDISVVITRLV